MEKSLFVRKYLDRIKFNGDLLVDINTLKKIQKQHLLNIPFENLDIQHNKRIEFDIQKIWDKVISRKRGGICYELNGLLLYLLKEIGFDVKYIAAKVLEDGDQFDHVLLVVHLSGEDWLVDVGFGDNFLEPLKLATDEIQRDIKGDFKIIKNENYEYRLLKKINKSEFSLEYIFNLKERELKDFRERCLAFETSSNSMFRKNTICSIERENGRISLSDNKITETKNGKRVIKKINNDDEFKYNLKNIFDIEIML